MYLRIQAKNIGGKVDSYVQKFEDLPEEDLKKIMNQAKDMVEANLKNR